MTHLDSACANYEFLTEAGQAEVRQTLSSHSEHVTHANQVLKARLQVLLEDEGKLSAIEMNLHLKELLALAGMNIDQLKRENEELEAQIQACAQCAVQVQDRINLNHTVATAIA